MKFGYHAGFGNRRSQVQILLWRPYAPVAQWLERAPYKRVTIVQLNSGAPNCDIAQQVEQRTVNPRVAGSSPAIAANCL